MCKIIYFICVAANIAIASSWDFAITTKTQIQFFDNVGTLQGVEDWQFTDLNAIYYDTLNDVLYFVTDEHENASISSIHLSKREYKQIIKRRPGESILGIAFDPLTEMLFWVNPTNKSIMRASLPLRLDNDGNGQVLLQMKDELPHAITVDSCKGYIYWTNVNKEKPTIERSRFDGSQRQVIVHEYLTMPISVVVDQESQRIYWADLEEGLFFNIGSADFDGKNRKVIYSGINHQVNSLAVRNNTLYWTDRHMFVWSYPITKEPNGLTQSGPIKVTSFKKEEPLSIVTNNDLQKQTMGVPECKSLIRAFLDKKVNINHKNDKGPYEQLDGNDYCQNEEGSITYTKPCERLCYNYCLEGTCVMGSKRKCICKPGYSGDKCENNDCQNYCTNGGTCLISSNILKCVCSNGYSGTRCENATVREEKANYNCSVDILPKKNLTSSNALTNSELRTPECVGLSCYHFDMSSPVTICLSILCVLLCVLCIVLIWQNLKLKKRLRKNKRTKNTRQNENTRKNENTPQPAPQYEIIIENCCNMNICDTPCFAPPPTPSQLDIHKNVKEEKRNLIMNMEQPDDSY